MVPPLVSHYRVNVCPQHELAALAGEAYLSVPQGHQLSPAVEAPQREHYFGPCDDVHAGGQEVEAETESGLSLPGLAEVGLAFGVLRGWCCTSISGVSSCHSCPM